MTNQARAALMRLRDKLRAEGMRTIGVEDQWNTGYRAACQHWCDWIDRELAALPADEMSPPFEGDPKDCAFRPADESAVCEFCEGPLGDKADHGLGECCSVCPTCDGAGTADNVAGARDLVAEERAKLVRRVGSDCCHGTDPACGGGCLFERAVRNLDMGAECARKPQPDERDKTIAELREKVADLQDEVDHWMNAQPIHCPPEHAEMRKRAEKAEAEAEELREQLAAANAAAAELDQKNAALRDALADEQAKAKPEPAGEDDVLHRWLRLHRRGFHDDAFFDAREGALSELCRRALAGGGRQEVGDV